MLSKPVVDAPPSLFDVLSPTFLRNKIRLLLLTRNELVNMPNDETLRLLVIVDPRLYNRFMPTLKLHTSEMSMGKWRENDRNRGGKHWTCVGLQIQPLQTIFMSSFVCKYFLFVLEAGDW